MSLCVDNVGGTLVVSPDVFPDCTQYVLLSPGYMERLTYWADLSIALDPSEPELYVLMSATLAVFALAIGWKIVIRQVFNR